MLEITVYEIHHYEVTIENKTLLFYTEEDMLDFANSHQDEPFTAKRVDYPIFTETED